MTETKSVHSNVRASSIRSSRGRAKNESKSMVEDILLGSAPNRTARPYEMRVNWTKTRNLSKETDKLDIKLNKETKSFNHLPFE